jgi:hypothetical protein
MTLIELKKKIDEEVEKGHGDTPVYFDTEAGEFQTHLVSIDSAYFEDNKECGLDETLFILYTEAPIIH